MMTSCIRFNVGDQIYTRAQFDWHQIRTYTVVSRSDDHVTVIDQFGQSSRAQVRTVQLDDITVEAITLGIYKYSTILYSHMRV